MPSFCVGKFENISQFRAVLVYASGRVAYLIFSLTGDKEKNLKAAKKKATHKAKKPDSNLAQPIQSETTVGSETNTSEEEIAPNPSSPKAPAKVKKSKLKQVSLNAIQSSASINSDNSSLMNGLVRCGHRNWKAPRNQKSLYAFGLGGP